MHNHVFIRSILLTTATARSKSTRMCDVYICSGDLLDPENYKQRCIIQMGVTQKDFRTVQAIPENFVLKAGTNIFVLWKFDTVHPAEYRPKVVKLHLEGSMLRPPASATKFGRRWGLMYRQNRARQQKRGRGGVRTHDQELSWGPRSTLGTN